MLLLGNRLKRFLHRQMQNYPDNFKIVNWNSFDVVCKNKRAIFTHCANFICPLFPISEIMSPLIASNKSIMTLLRGQFLDSSIMETVSLHSKKKGLQIVRNTNFLLQAVINLGFSVAISFFVPFLTSYRLYDNVLKFGGSLKVIKCVARNFNINSLLMFTLEISDCHLF